MKNDRARIDPELLAHGTGSEPAVIVMVMDSNMHGDLRTRQITTNPYPTGAGLEHLEVPHDFHLTLGRNLDTSDVLAEKNVRPSVVVQLKANLAQVVKDARVRMRYVALL